MAAARLQSFVDERLGVGLANRFPRSQCQPVLPLDAYVFAEDLASGQLLLAADPGHVRSAHHPLDAIAFRDYYSSLCLHPAYRSLVSKQSTHPELSPPHQRD